MLCYDCTNRSTFSNVTNWLTNIENQASPSVVLCLIATKSDVPDFAVRNEDGENLAKNHNMLFFSTSSLLGTNIKEAFAEIAKEVMKRLKIISSTAEEPPTRRITIKNNE